MQSSLLNVGNVIFVSSLERWKIIAVRLRLQLLQQFLHWVYWVYSLDTENSFRNPIESNRNQIVFTIFQLIWNQTDVCLVPNQSVHSKYNLISVWLINILKRFLCVWGPVTRYADKTSCFQVLIDPTYFCHNYSIGVMTCVW